MKGPWILLGVGGMLLLITGMVAIVSLLLPVLTDRKVSMEEAMFGFVPGCACSFLSLFLVLGGVIWLVIASNQNRRP